MERMIRALKGLLLFVAFMGIGLSTFVETDGLMTRYLNSLGANVHLLSLSFCVAAVMNLFIGVTGRRWNGLWFSPMIFYMGFVWAAAFQLRDVSYSPAFAYTLLAGLLVIDFAVDAYEVFNANRR